MSQKILVVDDSRTVRTVVEWVFHGSPYQVILAATASDAMRLMREHRPAAALVDYSLPDQSGYELCQELRRDPSLSGVPLIMFGGNWGGFDEGRVAACGADDFLYKPFKTDALIEKVTGAISRKNQRPLHLTPGQQPAAPPAPAFVAPEPEAAAPAGPAALEVDDSQGAGGFRRVSAVQADPEANSPPPLPAVSPVETAEYQRRPEPPLAAPEPEQDVELNTQDVEAAPSSPDSADDSTDYVREDGDDAYASAEAEVDDETTYEADTSDEPEPEPEPEPVPEPPRREIAPLPSVERPRAVAPLPGLEPLPARPAPLAQSPTVPTEAIEPAPTRAADADPEAIEAAVAELLPGIVKQLLPSVVKETLAVLLRETIGARVEGYATKKIDTFVDRELPGMAERAIDEHLATLYSEAEEG